MVMDEDIDVEDDTQINDETEVVEPMENETNDESNTKESPNQKLRLVRLPLARIKTIMKLDPDCAMISQDSAFLVTKATEMFIDFLARESGKQLGTVKRKTLMKRDVDVAIQNCSNLCFLDGALDW